MKDSMWRRFFGRHYDAVRTNSHPEEECDRSPRNVARHLLSGQYRTALAIACLGMIGLGTGIFVVVLHPYDILFQLKCIFADGGEIFELWRTPPVDLYLRVFLFNVTNREAFLRGDEKLKIEEVGPYVYKELMSHESVVFNDNGTLSAVPQHPLVWMPELSEGRTEEDQLILPNIALLSIADVVSQQSFITRMGLNLLIRQTDSQPLVQMSAREFMFGYKSTLMTLGARFLSGWISFDKLGLIDRMYNFEGDFETVYTGEKDIRTTGLLDTYRGSRTLPEWDGACGNIHNASDGTKFPSYLTMNDSVLFFRKSMCRSQKLVAVNQTQVSGLNGYVYQFETDAMDNGRHNPDNQCYCSKDRCLPVGLLDVHRCYYGFPIAISYPHFLDADPVVTTKVDGYHPDAAKHRSYFIVEPESGLPLDVAVRFQINMALGDISSMVNVEQFKDMVLPLLWTESRMYGLPEKLSARFKLYLNVLPVVEQSIMYLSFVWGTLLLALAFRKLMTKFHRATSLYQGAWLDEEEPDINRKLSSYASYVPGGRNSMSSKELEVYFNSLITPLNQDLEVEGVNLALTVRSDDEDSC